LGSPPVLGFVSRPIPHALDYIEYISLICQPAGLNLTKDTRDRCTKAGITGWVKNSKQGTIVGKMQGPKEEVDKL